MKIYNLVLVFTFLFSTNVWCQTGNQYNALVEEASQLYDNKAYEESAVKYKEAFDQLDGKAYPNDRYNAACSYALAGKLEEAFYHLNYLADHPKVMYRNYNHITTDTDLKSLYPDPRWEKLLATVMANKKEYEKDLNQPLVRELDTIYQSDQGLRREISEIEEQYGFDSEEMSAHWKKINEVDSINLIKVTRILDEHGWLGPKVIGNEGNSTLFLVIQPADLDTQVKYLPMMREAVEMGNARPSSLALLEDRVALRQGGKQIYGSQIGRDEYTGAFYVSPLVDPEKVNDRRAEMGLGPIEQYVSRWNIEWDVEEHKARTSKMEIETED